VRRTRPTRWDRSEIRKISKDRKNTSAEKHSRISPECFYHGSKKRLAFHQQASSLPDFSDFHNSLLHESAFPLRKPAGNAGFVSPDRDVPLRSFRINNRERLGRRFQEVTEVGHRFNCVIDGIGIESRAQEENLTVHAAHLFVGCPA